MKLLIIGAHPDDIEIACSGTLAKCVKRGDTVIELSSKEYSVLEYLIEKTCPEGGVVLDCFMGSGTTAKVARALGRHYIGFEISAEYCDIIRQRLEQTKSLFDL